MNQFKIGDLQSPTVGKTRRSRLSTVLKLSKNFRRGHYYGTMILMTSDIFKATPELVIYGIIKSGMSQKICKLFVAYIPSFTKND